MAGRKKEKDIGKKWKEELEAYVKWSEKCNEAAEKQYQEEQEEQKRAFADDDDY